MGRRNEVIRCVPRCDAAAPFAVTACRDAGQPVVFFLEDGYPIGSPSASVEEADLIVYACSAEPRCGQVIAFYCVTAPH